LYLRDFSLVDRKVRAEMFDRLNKFLQRVADFLAIGLERTEFGPHLGFDSGHLGDDLVHVLTVGFALAQLLDVLAKLSQLAFDRLDAFADFIVHSPAPKQPENRLADWRGTVYVRPKNHVITQM
jgi:hypothetical protein